MMRSVLAIELNSSLCPITKWWIKKNCLCKHVQAEMQGQNVTPVVAKGLLMCWNNRLGRWNRAFSKYNIKQITQETFCTEAIGTVDLEILSKLQNS